MKKPVKVVIDPLMIPPGKNVSGILGEKCNNCGGFAYTMSIGGKQLKCDECEQTGVKLPTRRELQTQISEMKQDLHNLRKAILDSIGIKVAKPKVKEISN